MAILDTIKEGFGELSSSMNGIYDMLTGEDDEEYEDSDMVTNTANPRPSPRPLTVQE